MASVPAAPDSARAIAASKAKTRMARQVARQEQDAAILAVQAAALDVPVSRLAAAKCLLGISGIVFNQIGVDPAAKVVSQRLGIPELELREGMLDVMRQCKGSADKPGPPEKKQKTRRLTVNPYNLFQSYTMKELPKHTDLPFVRKYFAEHGEHARIDFQATSVMWNSLKADDKKRLGQRLKPFLDDLYKTRKDKAAQEQGGPGADVAGAGAGTGTPAGSAKANPGGAGPGRDHDFLELYLQYEKVHPEASLVRLLRLDGNKDDLDKELAGPSAGLQPLQPGNGAAAMDVDGTDGEEEEEEEEEEESSSSSDDGSSSEGAAVVVSSDNGDDDDDEEEEEEDEADDSSDSSADEGPDVAAAAGTAGAPGGVGGVVASSSDEEEDVEESESSSGSGSDRDSESEDSSEEEEDSPAPVAATPVTAKGGKGPGAAASGAKRPAATPASGQGQGGSRAKKGKK